jgi:hypothetical protein
MQKSHYSYTDRRTGNVYVIERPADLPKPTKWKPTRPPAPPCELLPPPPEPLPERPRYRTKRPLWVRRKQLRERYGRAWSRAMV